MWKSTFFRTRRRNSRRKCIAKHWIQSSMKRSSSRSVFFDPCSIPRRDMIEIELGLRWNRWEDSRLRRVRFWSIFSPWSNRRDPDYLERSRFGQSDSWNQRSDATTRWTRSGKSGVDVCLDSSILISDFLGKQTRRHLLFASVRSNRRQADRDHTGSEESEEDGRRRSFR